MPLKIRIFRREESSVFNCDFRYIQLISANNEVIHDHPYYSDEVPMDRRKLKRYIRKLFN